MQIRIKQEPYNRRPCQNGRGRRHAPTSVLAVALAAACTGLLWPAAAVAETWRYLYVEPQHKAGLIYPDYDPNGFSVIFLSCLAGEDVIEASIDLGLETSPGQAVTLDILVDGQRVKRIAARGEYNEMDGTVELTFRLPARDPALARMRDGGRVALQAGGVQFDTPARGRKQALSGLLKGCGG